MNALFDKRINLYLYDTPDGSGKPVDVIDIMDTGIKPNIGIQTTFTTAEVVYQTTIRLTNFYPAKALTEYKYFRLQAGYKDSAEWAGFGGIVWVAYKDSPSPDGVTTFMCTVANMTDVLNTKINLHAKKTDTLEGVFDKIITALKGNSGSAWTLENSLDSIPLIAPIDFIGAVKDLLVLLKQLYGFVYSFEDCKLVVYKKGGSRTKLDIVDINYISGVPSVIASGITFYAPWMPQLLPGMRVRLSPKYKNVNFAATQVNINSVLTIQNMSIEFNTVTEQNKMTILALNV